MVFHQHRLLAQQPAELDADDVVVNLDRSGGCSVLELNITLPPVAVAPADA